MQAKTVKDDRARLIDGFIEAVVARGYAASTTADIVAQAGTSKRTFYENFSSKEDCFLAAYASVTERVIRSMREAVEPDGRWQDQIRSMMRAYLSALQLRPEFARTCFLEIQAAGPAALKLRLKVHRRFTELIQDLVSDLRRENPRLPKLSDGLATALVGGVNELVIQAAEKNRTHELIELEETAVRFALAVISG